MGVLGKSFAGAGICECVYTVNVFVMKIYMF